MEPETKAAPRMAQLDGLRALAVIAVMWEHWAPPGLRFGISWGLGVQLFFVLSGFLITGILLTNRLHSETSGQSRWRGRLLRAFYARRSLRIFPIYYIVLFTAASLGISSLPETLWWHVLYLSNFSFHFHPGFGTSIGHLWSLAVEEQFYLFWPLLILTIPYRFLPVTLLAVIAIGPIYRLYGILYSPIGHFFIGTPGSFDSLGLGALVAYGMKHQNGITDALFRLEMPIGLASLAMGFLIMFDVFPRVFDSLHFLAWSIFFVLVIRRAALGRTGPLQYLLNNSLLRYIGTISYGLYLYHNFAGGPSMWLIREFPVLADIPACILVLNTLITLAVASLSWFLIEKPINRLKNRFPYVS